MADNRFPPTYKPPSGSVPPTAQPFDFASWFAQNIAPYYGAQPVPPPTSQPPQYGGRGGFEPGAGPVNATDYTALAQQEAQQQAADQAAADRAAAAKQQQDFQFAQMGPTWYQQQQSDLANRRFQWEQEQAKATEQRQHERDVSGAYQNYYDHILSYMGTHPTTGQAVGAGYLPYNGANYAQRAPIDPMVLEYYKAHPELGQAPGEGPVGVGYHGNASEGSNMMQMVQPMGNTQSAQKPGNQIGINLPDFMYGLTTANGTPVPLGPQQEAQLQSSKENANAFNDYVGNYAGFDPSSLLAESNFGGLGQISQKNLSEPTNFSAG